MILEVSVKKASLFRSLYQVQHTLAAVYSGGSQMVVTKRAKMSSMK